MEPSLPLSLSHVPSHFQATHRQMSRYAHRLSQDHDLASSLFDVDALQIHKPDQHIQRLVQSTIQKVDQAINNLPSSDDDEDEDEYDDVLLKHRNALPTYEQVVAHIVQQGTATSATFRSCMANQPMMDEPPTPGIAPNQMTYMSRGVRATKNCKNSTNFVPEMHLNQGSAKNRTVVELQV